MLSVFIQNADLLSVVAPCPSLTLKYYIRLDSQARDKHSSLFCFATSDGEKSNKKMFFITFILSSEFHQDVVFKKFFRHGYLLRLSVFRCHNYITFHLSLMLWINKLECLSQQNVLA
jgi:hypothetical protein